MTGRTRRIVLALSAAAAASVVTIAGLFALDLYLHKRAERSAGVNVWGYRGSVVPGKRPGEVRVVVLGGSTVFGYGLTWDQAFPAQLERRLNRDGGDGARYTVVNLGYNNEGSYSWLSTLGDYAYLQPDIVCLYEGYNDLMGDANGGNPAVYRHRSPLFRATGYFPILPLVLREKAMALRFGGSLNDAYVRDGKTVFQPTLMTRATSGALDTTANISELLERQFARAGSEQPAVPVTPTGGGCAFPWRLYCGGVAAAIDNALSRGWRVVFVTQPYLATERAHERHVSQQHAVAAMLRERYTGRPGFRYVDLGDALDVRDAAVAFDGMHLTSTGNGRIADRLVQPVLEAAADHARAATR